eukprot:TRINITY_DN11147_c0_g1_i4.p1 TRINITY_DN11147_c0_g1~~TRINITY_DN11147_c0_g1_i4.p1  ORF type:complete len:316 (-),score=72.38 TRINITY_DN11147_c0_g1_i4:19-966(-)
MVAAGGGRFATSLTCRMTLPAMHFRWSFPEQRRFIEQEFGRHFFGESGSAADQREMGAKIASKMNSYLPVLGITQQTMPEIERVYYEILDSLEHHFTHYPYLLGSSPTLADFGLMGPFYAHLFRDPVPGKEMKMRAPLVSEWCEKMNGWLPSREHLHTIRDDNTIVPADFAPSVAPPPEDQSDVVPETLLPFLEVVCREMVPILAVIAAKTTEFVRANPTAERDALLPRSLGIQEMPICGVFATRTVNPYSLWMYQRPHDYYHELPAADRAEIDRLLEQLPHGPGALSLDLKGCRVKRVSNKLARDSSALAKSKL